VTRGRKPKPTAIKKLAGNPGKRPLNASEPQPPVPDSTPYAPRFLNADGKKEWRRIVGILMDLGLYTEVDRAALAMYCQAWGRWVHAERKCGELADKIVATTDKGYSHLHAWRLEANKAQAQLLKAMTEFGMTPSSRSRVHVSGEPTEPSLAEQLFALVGSVEEADDDGD